MKSSQDPLMDKKFHFDVHDDTKIFVSIPAMAVTGGPESLHQLVHLLREESYEAFVTYHKACSNQYVNNGKSPVYNDYNTPESPIIDSSRNILVVPEIHLDVLKLYSNIQTGMWWLACPGYVQHESELYLAQSAKALQDCSNMGMWPVVLMNDYPNDIYFKPSPAKEREDIIIYNPAKGFEHTATIMALLDNWPITWVPIQSMSRKDIILLMDRAKAYIDFGHHPGRDRLPREAASRGLIVLTNKNGTAGIREDIPIPEYFKFDNATLLNQKGVHVTAVIIEIIRKYENYKKYMTPYVNQIKQDKERLRAQIRRIFKYV